MARLKQLPLTEIVWRSTFLSLNSRLNITLISRDNVSDILLFLGLFAAANLQIAFLNAGFRASGHYARGVWLNNLSRIAEIGTVFIVLFAGGGPVAIAAAMAGVRMLTYGVARWQLNLVAPWAVIGWRHASSQAILDMARPAIAFMAFPIGNAFKNQGVLMVVGVALGPAAGLELGDPLPAVGRLQGRALGIVGHDQAVAGEGRLGQTLVGEGKPWKVLTSSL